MGIKFLNTPCEIKMLQSKSILCFLKLSEIHICNISLKTNLNFAQEGPNTCITKAQRRPLGIFVSTQRGENVLKLLQTENDKIINLRLKREGDFPWLFCSHC